MNETQESQKITHYYGNSVRTLFMLAAIIMVVSLPIFKLEIGFPVIVSVIAILILGLAAGLTNPQQSWDAGVNLVVSASGFLIFMTYAVNTYREKTLDRFFLTNLILSFIFLLAVYFSVKTLRGAMLQKR